ncbi:MAG: hypothetical protein J5598_02230 [Clostridia bacterium]|nr:hypothetical protein [Clostridia bacterium]
MLRKKLVINLAIILICGTVALSLPVIVNHLPKTTNASTNTNKENCTTITPNTDWYLTSIFVGHQYHDKVDCGVVWQIEQKCGDNVIATWDEIYANINTANPLSYDHENLTLTSYGLVYIGLQSDADYQILYASGYQSTVIYQNHSCVLTLN